MNHKHPAIWTLIIPRYGIKMQQTKLKSHSSTIWVPLDLYRKIKHLYEEYKDDSGDIPNVLNAIANFIRK